MLGLLFRNHIGVPLENKMDQLRGCLEQMLDHSNFELLSVTCDDLGYKTPNFTTAGIYHLHGIVNVNKEEQPWSIILKVIKPDSVEKDDPLHHNYWRREALVIESSILNELPESIRTAKSYLVEEQQDGTVWIWMERVAGEHANSQDHFTFIARQLGRFNGTYLNGKSLPNEEWICKGWLRSWTTGCKMYAPKSESYLKQLQKENERNIWTWFQEFTGQIDEHLASLEQLPRVLAHQDLSPMNMLIVKQSDGTDQVVLIDWQFMSISGVGEDLGKMFGVSMSLGIVPPTQYGSFKQSLFEAYILGLKDTGWQGDERLARYGYYLSSALRCEWEVPKYFSLVEKLENGSQNAELLDEVEHLEAIINMQRVMAKDAESLKTRSIFPKGM
ncbi:phosphotransferase [Paenibacillus sp. GSMTC-2017]|uniref:phosphotransferase n=1 Tax=Paenibacillus sp. GSMTC-2017 TaxID=2794350 RepID=UPI0018D8BF32|nr:phosphotransferase [Paenibacillus sp. GSMTC-2017]MBH5316841.1 phosphotransferase [Paenibacillus sp. GSMTC-2017]